MAAQSRSGEDQPGRRQEEDLTVSGAMLAHNLTMIGQLFRGRLIRFAHQRWEWTQDKCGGRPSHYADQKTKQGSSRLLTIWFTLSGGGNNALAK